MINEVEKMSDSITTAQLLEALRCNAWEECDESCPCYRTDSIKCTNERLVQEAAANRIEELQREVKAHSKWISVDERLPEDEGDKFIRYGFVHAGRISDRRFIGASCYYVHDKVPHWNNEGFKGMKVTHWMEPPEDPVEDKL